jgi:hypothetical protein
LVVVPGADEVDGLDVGRGPEGELELNGGHDESNGSKIWNLKKVVVRDKDQEYRIDRTT